MKKIAILSFYSGLIQRGVENWTYELSSRLVESKEFDVLVIQNGPANKSFKYKQVPQNLTVNWNVPSSEGTFLRRIFLDYWSLLIAKFSIKAAIILFKSDFDIVISTGGGWESAIIRFVTILKRNKMVVVGHSGIGWDDRNNLLCFPDVFVSLSSYALKWAKSVNPFIKIVKIPNGVDVKKFNPKGPTLKLELKKPIVLVVSALIPGKRVDLVIKAMSKVKKASLLIVGKGELKSKLEILGNKLLEDRFALVDLPYSDMPSVYRAAKLFVSASEPYYPFEMVITEAMASGLPVVANKDEIREEIVGKAGILIDPENTEELADVIRKALSVRWGNESLVQAEEFSWAKISQKYSELFNSLK